MIRPWRLLACLLLTAPLLAAEARIDREVRRGDRLEVRNYKGRTEVSVWGQDRIEVQADAVGDEEIRVQRRGSTWIVVPASWERDSEAFDVDLPDRAQVRVEGNEPPPVDLRITIPPWLPLVVESPMGEVEVRGTEAAVDVTTLLGDVDVQGGADRVRLRSMNGTLKLAGARGRITLEATWQTVTVRDSGGDLRIETTRGDIRLEDLDVDDLEAVSIDGDIELRGALTPGGRYELGTHAGDVALVVASPVNAAFTVRAFRGELVTDLDVPRDLDDRRASFTLGDGSARVELESFSGRVRIRASGGTR